MVEMERFLNFLGAKMQAMLPWRAASEAVACAVAGQACIFATVSQ